MIQKLLRAELILHNDYDVTILSSNLPGTISDHSDLGCKVTLNCI